jgi:hypothetical protein
MIQSGMISISLNSKGMISKGMNSGSAITFSFVIVQCRCPLDRLKRGAGGLGQH